MPVTRIGNERIPVGWLHDGDPAGKEAKVAKGNVFWCDDCGTYARGLSDLFDGAPALVTWCPGCGRLEDENGTVTPRESKKTAGKIAAQAVKGLTAEDVHQKQHYLEEVLQLAVGEQEYYEQWADHGWELGIEP